MTAQPIDRGHRKKREFTIDGRRFAIEESHRTATQLLALAGLPAAGYDLTRVRKHGAVETFRDEENVHVKDGDEFVSVNRQGTVA